MIRYMVKVDGIWVDGLHHSMQTALAYARSYSTTHAKVEVLEIGYYQDSEGEWEQDTVELVAFFGNGLVQLNGAVV